MPTVEINGKKCKFKKRAQLKIMSVLVAQARLKNRVRVLYKSPGKEPKYELIAPYWYDHETGLIGCEFKGWTPNKSQWRTLRIERILEAEPVQIGFVPKYKVEL